MLTNKEIKLSQNICDGKCVCVHKPEEYCHEPDRSAYQPWNIATTGHIWKLRMKSEAERGR